MLDYNKITIDAYEAVQDLHVNNTIKNVTEEDGFPRDILIIPSTNGLCVKDGGTILPIMDSVICGVCGKRKGKNAEMIQINGSWICLGECVKFAVDLLVDSNKEIFNITPNYSRMLLINIDDTYISVYTDFVDIGSRILMYHSTRYLIHTIANQPTTRHGLKYRSTSGHPIELYYTTKLELSDINSMGDSIGVFTLTKDSSGETHLKTQEPLSPIELWKFAYYDLNHYNNQLIDYTNSVVKLIDPDAKTVQNKKQPFQQINCLKNTLLQRYTLNVEGNSDEK